MASASDLSTKPSMVRCISIGKSSLSRRMRGELIPSKSNSPPLAHGLSPLPLALPSLVFLLRAQACERRHAGLGKRHALFTISQL